MEFRHASTSSTIACSGRPEVSSFYEEGGDLSGSYALMTHRPQALPFDVGYTTDDVVRATRRTRDERDWEREQRSKRRKTESPELPGGPCCARCEHWVGPMKTTTRCGRCLVIVALSDRVPPGYDRPGFEKGHVFPIGEARSQRLAGYEGLATGPAYSCAEGSVMCPFPGFTPSAGEQEVAA